jgi:hypothetical protein
MVQLQLKKLWLLIKRFLLIKLVVDQRAIFFEKGKIILCINIFLENDFLCYNYFN